MNRSSYRARTSERGFVLLAAIVLAVLYFGLMELLLLDSSRELHEAQRFRARIVAATLAENAAELATLHVVTGAPVPVSESDTMGKMTGALRFGASGPAGKEFSIRADGATTGILKQAASVQVFGVLNGGEFKIDYTYHSQ